MVAHACNASTQEAKLEDHKFQANLSSILRKKKGKGRE
jgi:hypothetical protein